MWIITKNTPRKILLVYHKKLKRWVQPGGHIEPFENPIEAAIREVKEETGIDISYISKNIKKIDKYGKFIPLPTFIMEQTILKYKNCPEHYHLDIQYVIKINEQKVLHDSKESRNIGWFTKKQALKLPIHEDTRAVINKLL